MPSRQSAAANCSADSLTLGTVPSVVELFIRRPWALPRGGRQLLDFVVGERAGSRGVIDGGPHANRRADGKRRTFARRGLERYALARCPLARRLAAAGNRHITGPRPAKLVALRIVGPMTTSHGRQQQQDRQSGHAPVIGDRSHARDYRDGSQKIFVARTRKGFNRLHRSCRRAPNAAVDSIRPCGCHCWFVQQCPSQHFQWLSSSSTSLKRQRRFFVLLGSTCLLADASARLKK
jgi:hypothetical protein